MLIIYARRKLALLHRRAPSLRRNVDSTIAILRDEHWQRGVRRHAGRRKHRRDHQQSTSQVAVLQIRQDAEGRIGALHAQKTRVSVFRHRG